MDLEPFRVCPNFNKCKFVHVDFASCLLSNLRPCTNKNEEMLNFVMNKCFIESVRQSSARFASLGPHRYIVCRPP